MCILLWSVGRGKGQGGEAFQREEAVCSRTIAAPALMFGLCLAPFHLFPPARVP